MAFVKVSVHFRLETGDALLQKCGLEKGGRVQKAIDNAVIRHAIPYCPMTPEHLPAVHIQQVHPARWYIPDRMLDTYIMVRLWDRTYRYLRMTAESLHVSFLQKARKSILPERSLNIGRIKILLPVPSGLNA